MVMRCKYTPREQLLTIGLLTLGGLLIVALMVLVIIRAPSTALDDEL
jgi:hypothetical protein